MEQHLTVGTVFKCYLWNSIQNFCFLSWFKTKPVNTPLVPIAPRVPQRAPVEGRTKALTKSRPQAQHNTFRCSDSTLQPSTGRTLPSLVACAPKGSPWCTGTSVDRSKPWPLCNAVPCQPAISENRALEGRVFKQASWRQKQFRSTGLLNLDTVLDEKVAKQLPAQLGLGSSAASPVQCCVWPYQLHQSHLPCLPATQRSHPQTEENSMYLI